ncbi:MAG: methyltransferase domain-containing protein [Methylococcaceae bacterium]|nr:methyltransferase domain-containing protein [Methylococcaceae bacterium]
MTFYQPAVMNPRQNKWDEIYRKASLHWRPAPAYVLQAYDYLLPSRGTAIDLASGFGANALFLAKRGFKTQAWDLSPVAVARLNQIARQDKLDLVCEARDLESAELPQEGFDVLVMTRFLDRNLTEALAGALRPGGLLYFQTFTRDKDPSVGPGNPDYLLAENELARMFTGLVLRAYCEAGRAGDLARGLRNEACLVAQKPCIE